VELLGRYSNHDQVITRLSTLLNLPDRGVGQEARRRPKRARRLGESDQLDLANAYLAGDSLPVLALLYGISRQTVSSILERHGVPRRRRSLSSEEVSIAADLYNKGRSLAKIGKEFQMDAGTVHDALRIAGITMRPVGTNQWSGSDIPLRA